MANWPSYSEGRNLIRVGFDRNQRLGGEGSLKRHVLRAKSCGFERPRLFHELLKWLAFRLPARLSRRSSSRKVLRRMVRKRAETSRYYFLPMPKADLVSYLVNTLHSTQD
jgi:hypothetical protein